MQEPPKQSTTRPAGVFVEGLPDLESGKSGLIYLVDDAVEAVDWPHKAESFSIEPTLRFPSRAMMALEVYCYAKGTYNSQEVEHASHTDPILQQLFPDQWPDRRTILKYRRQHRAPIKECLRHVFQNAFIARFGLPDSDDTPIDFCVAMALDRWFEPVCGPQPSTEADERIDRAVFWDGVETP